MVEYDVQAKKLEFGNNSIEELLSKFGLKIKSIATTDQDNKLIYETEREKRLTPRQMNQIESNRLIVEICAVY